MTDVFFSGELAKSAEEGELGSEEGCGEHDMIALNKASRMCVLSNSCALVFVYFPTQSVQTNLRNNAAS